MYLSFYSATVNWLITTKEGLGRALDACLLEWFSAKGTVLLFSFGDNNAYAMVRSRRK